MSHELDQIMEAIEDIGKIIGKSGPIHFNTGIYEREIGEYEKIGLYDIEDLIVLGENGEMITMEHVKKLFNYMKKQFKQLEDNGYEYAYFYEGINYNEKDNIYEVLWGS